MLTWPLLSGALVLVEQQRAQESLQWSLFSPTARCFSHLWAWFICLWPGEALGLSSDQVKPFVSLFIYLLTLTRASLVLPQADKASLTESPLTEANS